MRGIPVLQQADTVRYLGYQVGLRPLRNCNWALRIRKLQRRLMTASRVATSVANRVLILNSIIIPSVLFTAAVFDMPEWARVAAHNLYKKICGIMRLQRKPADTRLTRDYFSPPKRQGGWVDLFGFGY